MTAIIFVLIFAWFSLQSDVTATVYYEKGVYEIKVGKYDLDKGICAGRYKPTFEEVYWDYLDIETTENFKDYKDSEIEYSVGLLEGFLTHERIYNIYQNAIPFMLSGFNYTLPKDVEDYLTKQRAWVMEKDSTDPFWEMAQGTYSFLDGMMDGYNSVSKHQLGYFQVYTIFTWGDILALLGVIPSVPFPKGIYDDRCTGGVRYSEKDNDIYFSHTSWFMYSFSIKFFKSYKMRFNNPLVKADTTYFSSYPATPTSSDDFYVTSGDLFILETTLSCFNDSMSKLLTPNSLLYWQRLLIANRFADSATDWTKYFSMYNGGTYNEFIVLDLKKAREGLSKKGDFPSNTLVLLNQIPDLIDVIDVTEGFSNQGYWPSYNVPYSQEVYKRCDIEQFIQKYPDQVHMYDYNKCCRALIFKRDAPKIDSLEDMKSFMRYNDYTNDPLSMGHSTYAISARFDLEITSPTCGGGYDSKVVGLKSWDEDKEISIIGGAVYKDVPVFKFSTTPVCDGVIHDGIPDELKFDWQTVSYKD